MATVTEMITTALCSACAATLAAIATHLIKRRPAIIDAEATAQNSVNDGFAKLSTALLARMETLETQNRTLIGEVDNLSQHVYSLEKLLREHGIPIPVRVRPAVFSELAGMKQ